MVTTARTCAGCGAPLPGTEDESAAIRCPFCGVVNDIAMATPGTINVRIETSAPAPSRSAAWIVVVATLVPILVAGAVIAFVVMPAMRNVHEVTTAIAHRVLPPATLTTSTLSTLGRTGWMSVEAAAPAGGYGAFDASAQYPWALAIAQAWQPDVRVRNIDVVRVRPDGTMNLADDADARVRYTFVSPSRLAAWREQATLKANVVGEYGIVLEVSKGAIKALLDYGQPDTRHAVPPPPAILPLTTTLKQAARARQFPALPFYSGDCIHNEDEGWVWYFHSLAGQSFPRIRASDGRQFPYR